MRYSIRRNTETLLRVVFPHGLVLLHCILFLITRVFKKKYRSRKSTTKTRFIPLEADGNDRCRLRSGIALCKKCTEAADACLLFALHHADRSKKILRDWLSRRLFRPIVERLFFASKSPSKIGCECCKGMAQSLHRQRFVVFGAFVFSQKLPPPNRCSYCRRLGRRISVQVV